MGSEASLGMVSGRAERDEEGRDARADRIRGVVVSRTILWRTLQLLHYLESNERSGRNGLVLAMSVAHARSKTGVNGC